MSVVKHMLGELETKEETDGHFGIYPRETKECIAVVWDDPELDAKDIAERLVLCWNTHDGQQAKRDALLEACKQVRQIVADNCDRYACRDLNLIKLDAAIALCN